MEISEISQLQKEKHYLVSYMRNLTESNSWKQRVELAAVRGWGRMKQGNAGQNGQSFTYQGE